MSRRRVPALLLAVVALLLAGCTSTVIAPHAHHRGARPMMPMMPRVTGCATAQTTGPATGSPSGTVVRVVLMDPGRMMGGSGPMRLLARPSVVPSGEVTFVASNHGRHTHELVVLPLGHRYADGQRAVGPDFLVSERGSLGEASRSCGEGSGEGIEPGTTGWVTLRLPPGRDELVCNEPHHYQRGMHAVLEVR